MIQSDLTLTLISSFHCFIKYDRYHIYEESGFEK